MGGLHEQLAQQHDRHLARLRWEACGAAAERFRGSAQKSTCNCLPPNKLVHRVKTSKVMDAECLPIDKQTIGNADEPTT